MKTKELRHGKGFSWLKDDGKEYAMERCHECGRENYIINVMSGQCTWCPYDVNKDEHD